MTRRRLSRPQIIALREQQQCYLFDHFIGPCEQQRRHGETKRLRGLEIDRQFVLGRCQHRQVGRLLAFEDAVDVARRSPKLIVQIRPVGDQAAAGDEVAERVMSLIAKCPGRG